MIDTKAKRILATAFATGSTHDFKLFKLSRTATAIAAHICCLGDLGYLGLTHLHANAQTPFRKSKHHPLTPEQKVFNRQLSRERIVIEHVIARLKVFRILSERYRNRRTRFGLRFNLIAAIYNREYASCACATPF